MNQRRARAPKNFVQKRDFLLPRREERKGRPAARMVHEEQPLNPSKATKWTKQGTQQARSRRAHKNPASKGEARRQAPFLLLLLPCQMQHLPFPFAPSPMELIHSHNSNPRKTKPLTRERMNATKCVYAGQETDGRTGRRAVAIPRWWRAAPC